MLERRPKVEQGGEYNREAFIHPTAVRDHVEHGVKLLAHLGQVSAEADVDAGQHELLCGHIVLRVLDAQVLLGLEALDLRSPEVSRVVELVQMERVLLAKVTPLVYVGLPHVRLVDNRVDRLVDVESRVFVELDDLDRS